MFYTKNICFCIFFAELGEANPYYPHCEKIRQIVFERLPNSHFWKGPMFEWCYKYAKKRSCEQFDQKAWQGSHINHLQKRLTWNLASFISLSPRIWPRIHSSALWNCLILIFFGNILILCKGAAKKLLKLLGWGGLGSPNFFLFFGNKFLY